MLVKVGVRQRLVRAVYAVEVIQRLAALGLVDTCREVELLFNLLHNLFVRSIVVFR